MEPSLLLAGCGASWDLFSGADSVRFYGFLAGLVVVSFLAVVGLALHFAAKAADPWS